jgi:hypothetical protein
VFRGWLLWFWVCVAPAALLGALAVVGDTVEIAWRFWFVSGPVLLVYGFFVWGWLEPAPPEPSDRSAAGLIVRLVGTLVVITLSIAVLGVLIALVMWAKWYLLIASPVWLAFGGWIGWGLWQDRRKARAEALAKLPKVVRGAGPGDGSKMVR